MLLFEINPNHTECVIVKWILRTDGQGNVDNSAVWWNKTEIPFHVPEWN